MFPFRQTRKIQRSEALLAFELPGGRLHCRLRLSNRRRTLALRVSASGEVVVNAPLRLAKGDIEQFLRKHADWIRARLEAVRVHAFVWQTDAPLPFRGEVLRLQLDAVGAASAHRMDDRLICSGDPVQAAAQALRWYQREARTLLLQRLAHFAPIAGVAMPSMRLSNARTRWGSLSAKGVVSLNWRLVKASAEELDYVICHELAHFRQRNHSAAFWHEVGRLFPDYLRVREKLRRDGQEYFAF